MFQNFLHHSVSSNHIPAHCGYAGNERADFLAKRRSISGSSVSDINWSKRAFKEVLNSKLKLKLDDPWKCEGTNPTTLDLIPDIMCLRKIEKLGSRRGSQNFLNWFLSGCCPLRKYLHAIKKLSVVPSAGKARTDTVIVPRSLLAVIPDSIKIRFQFYYIWVIIIIISFSQ